MKAFKPNLPYNVKAQLLMAVKKKEKGVAIKTYEYVDDIFISFRTFGGTEVTSNGSLVVENTAKVETYYRPEITASCRLMIGEMPYEIIGTPENINMQNRYMQFKVRAVEGGA